MTLPKSLEENFTEEIHRYEEEEKMPYITSFERLGIEKGLQKGLQQGRQEGRQEGRLEGLQQGLLQKSREALLEVLQVRFDTVPDTLI